jgi:hypothetical protein
MNLDLIPVTGHPDRRPNPPHDTAEPKPFGPSRNCRSSCKSFLVPVVRFGSKIEFAVALCTSLVATTSEAVLFRKDT